MLEKEIRDLRNRQDLPEMRQQLMDKENVHSTGIGYKIVGGVKTNTPALFAYVSEKKESSTLPEQSKIPNSVKGIRTDVHERGKGVILDSNSENSSPTRNSSRVRPVPGGVGIERQDGTGATAGVGAINSSDVKGILTVEHVFNDDGVYADNMYNPSYDTSASDNNNIGTPLSWNADEDWGFLDLDDPNWFTNETLGFGVVQQPERPTFTSRLMVSSHSVGLVGGELWAIDIEGASNTDYEYRVDEDIATSGSSGSLVGWYDASAGTVKPFAIHTSVNSSNPANKYASDLQETLSNNGFSLDTTNTYTLSPPSDAAFFEGTIISVDEVNEQVTCRVLNAGGTETTGTVDVREAGKSQIIDSTSVTLAGFEHQDVVLSTGGVEDSLLFSTPDASWVVDISRFAGEWQLETTFGEYASDVVGVDTDPSKTHTAIVPELSNIDIYEVGTWNRVRRFTRQQTYFEGSSAREVDTDFSNNGNWLAIGFSDANSNGNSQVSIYDVSADDPANWSYSTGVTEGSNGIRSAEFTPDSQFLIFGSSYTSNAFRVYETSSWTKVTELAVNDSASGMRISPDGSYAGLASTNGDFVIYEIGNADGTGWNQVTSFSIDTADLSSVGWSPDMSWVTVAGWNNEARIYSVGQSDGTGWNLQETKTRSGSIYTQQFTPDNQFLMVGEGVGGTLRTIAVYKVGDWTLKEELGGFADSIESINVDTTYVITGVRDEEVRVHTGPYHVEIPAAPTDLTATLR